jgi:hypothetical protein
LPRADKGYDDGMKYESTTHKQHFVSQVEQRMNATPGGERIYQFEIQRRGVAGNIRLSAPRKKLIETNLKMEDLFSFDVDKEANLRENFEELFQQYEGTVHDLTDSLLAKAAIKSSDVVTEVVDLLVAKLMNFARNPYCVAKTLDSFPALRNVYPTDPEKLKSFVKVLNGRRPHQTYLCQKLEISDEQYKAWLGTLFMLLDDVMPGHPTLLGQIVAGLFNSRETSACVMVSTYSSEKCLLSDRAMSTNLDGVKATGFDFNLRSNAFLRYVFMDKAAALAGKAHPSFIAQALEIDKTLKPRLEIRYEHDRLDLLRNYNWHVVNQSHQHVFSASKTVLL